MSSVLSMVEAKLPPGFRFHPRDDELVCDYLAPKIGKKDVGRSLLLPGLSEAMVDVDLNKCEPWDLPEAACVGGKEWYFFSIKDRKYATGQRTNRATESGYWKATGKDRRISRKGKLVGMRKTLVFYRGRAPKGKKTEWVMHEYRIQSKDDSSQLTTKEDWVLCRVFSKEKGGGTNPKAKTLTNYSVNNRDTAYASTYLPPLTDSHIASSGSHFIVPDASTMDNNLGNFGLIEQVPCFSSFNNNNNSGSSSSTLNSASTVMMNNINMGQWLDHHQAQYESTFLKVLGQLSNKPNLSEGCESEHHHIGSVSCWNPF